MKNEIKRKIEKADTVCIFTHVNEDADALGSALALREVICGMGKTADVYVEEAIEHRLEFLGGDYIVYEHGMCKSYELAIAVDCGSKDRLGGRTAIFDAAADTACIDHHGTNTQFANANYVEADAAATGQILFYLFREWGFDISLKTAEYLFAAIAADSGSFKYSCASEKTFAAAGELIKTGIDHAAISKRLFDTCTENAMRLHGYLMSSVKSFAGGRIALISSDEQLLERFGVSEREVGDLVNIPRQIEGVIIAAEIKRRKGAMRVSLRSDGSVDVSKLAVRLGGGGHFAAAGAPLDADTTEEAEKLIVEECIKLL